MYLLPFGQRAALCHERMLKMKARSSTTQQYNNPEIISVNIWLLIDLPGGTLMSQMKILNILTRLYIPVNVFDETVQFYQDLLGQSARLNFDYPEYDLKLAQTGSLLLIGGTAESLAPFRSTQATFLVSCIHEWEAYLPSTGTVILKPVKEVPTGWNMLVLHPDGMQVEYVEHRTKNPADNVLL